MARVRGVSDTLPMFPLNAVLFPGVTVPLKVFEDRYRAMIHHLLRVEDPTDRVFGSVGIREGYEVGEHGSQSLFKVGCRVKLAEVESNCRRHLRHRRRRSGADRAGPARHHRRRSRSATCTSGHSSRGTVPEEVEERARATFAAYRVALGTFREDPYPAELPRDPSYLSWTLAAVAPLPLHERQALLEAEDTATRLTMVTDLLRLELRAMNVIRSAARHRGGAHPLVPQLRRWRRRSSGGTPATVALTRAGVGFTLHEYAHDPRAAVVRSRGGRRRWRSIPARVLKTLMASRRR